MVVTVAEALSLAIDHHQCGRLDEAESIYRQILVVEPREPVALHNLGVIYHLKGDTSRAIAAYRMAIDVQPQYLDAYMNLGTALKYEAKYEEAITIFQRLVEVKRDDANLFNLLGLCYSALDRYSDAEQSFRKATDINSNSAEYFNNLGYAVRLSGRYEEALVYFHRALLLNNDYVEAQGNLSHVLLGMGDYQRGFHEYEQTRLKAGVIVKSVNPPPWNGEPLSGKRICLISEEGLGDTIQFIRFAKELKVRGAHVTLSVQKTLVKLLGSVDGIDCVSHGQIALDTFDYYTMLMSIPRVLATGLEDISRTLSVPYIVPDPEYLQYWSDRLGTRNNRELRVGIAWQGNPDHGHDRHRSVALSKFLSLADVPGIKFYILQKNKGVEQLEPLRGQLPICDLPDEPDRESDSFSDTAALMSLMDLVLTVDSSPVHLAGALGVPTWLLCSFNAEWRWLRDREDSPWYPTVRIFRQAKLNEWDEVFERICSELSRFQSSVKCE